MNLTFMTAVVSILVGLMCGSGEGDNHSPGLAVVGGIIGTTIGLAGAWLAYWLEQKNVLKSRAGSIGWLVALVEISRPFWIPLAVGAVAVFSVSAMARLGVW